MRIPSATWPTLAVIAGAIAMVVGLRIFWVSFTWQAPQGMADAWFIGGLVAAGVGYVLVVAGIAILAVRCDRRRRVGSLGI